MDVAPSQIDVAPWNGMDWMEWDWIGASVIACAFYILKGSSTKKYRLNLIFWIVMGQGSLFFVISVEPYL